MDRGVLYIASGDSYIDQAKKSAKSIKEHNPSLPVTLYCNKEISENVFDNIIIMNNSINNMGDSILSKDHFPYDKNLYVDVDTLICGSLDPVFDIIEDYDLAVARDTGDLQRKKIYDQLENSVPEIITECNSGVIAYTDSQQVKLLFENWNKLYEETDFSSLSTKTNQPALTFALYDSDISIFILPAEYNFQLNRNRFARSKIKILHKNGRAKTDLEKFAGRVNFLEKCRIISLEDYPCRVIPANYRSWKYRLKKISSKDTWKRLKQESNREQGKQGIIPFIKYLFSKYRRIN